MVCFKVWITLTFSMHSYIKCEVMQNEKEANTCKKEGSEDQDKWILLLLANAEGSCTDVPADGIVERIYFPLSKATNTHPQIQVRATYASPYTHTRMFNSFCYRSWLDSKFFVIYKEVLRNILSFSNLSRYFFPNWFWDSLIQSWTGYEK